MPPPLFFAPGRLLGRLTARALQRCGDRESVFSVKGPANPASVFFLLVRLIESIFFFYSGEGISISEKLV